MSNDIRHSSISSGRFDARPQDGNQFTALFRQASGRATGRLKVHLDDEFQPGAGLTQLLEAQLQPVNEIAAGFRALNLGVIGERRCSAANEPILEIVNGPGHV